MGNAGTVKAETGTAVASGKDEASDDWNDMAGSEGKATAEAQGEEATAEVSDDAKRRSPDPVETDCARGAGAVVAHQAHRDDASGWMAERTSMAGVSRMEPPPASPCSTDPQAWGCWMTGEGQTSFASRYCTKKRVGGGYCARREERME
ncbi:hypothetical protein C8R43DRAFT_945557 [Mycena crocata]|nr:hypothetical protein C8R43DRAFT_945557 [Mycena crocata]